jgi:hypothetical protein
MIRKKTQAEMVVDMLLAANGGYVTGPEIERALNGCPRTGGRLVDAARKARPDLTIINSLGQGYRIANMPLAAEAKAKEPATIETPAQAEQPTRLPPALASLKAALDAGNGQFVEGKRLASACGVPMPFLVNMIRALRTALPEAMIEGKRGYGYRLFVAGESHVAVDPKPRMANAAIPMHIRMAKTMAALDLIPTKAAEIVKVIALEANETGEQTLARLIAYGAEVHRDLVASGENPVGLRAIVKQDARP